MASGVGVAIVALAVLGNLTKVDPPDVPPDTTVPLGQPTTTAAFTAQGEPLDFEVVLTQEGRAALGHVVRDGAHYLFLSMGNDEEGWALGVETLVSPDGVTWESRGVGLTAPIRVGSVVGTDHGFLTHPYGPHRGSIVLWESDDGIDWKPVTVPLEPEETVHLLAVHSSGGLLVLVGQEGGHGDTAWDAISKAMKARYEVDSGHFDYQDTTEAGVYTVTWWGPLGVPLVVTNTRELGIEPDELISQPTSPSRVTVWSSSDGVTWQRTLVPELDWIEQVTSEPGGGIRLVGHSRSGQLIWFSSTDGESWEDMGQAQSSLHSVRHIGKGWWGVSTHTPDLLFSTDMEEWESVGVNQLFGSSRPWHVSQMTADETWTAAVFTSDTGNWAYIAPEPIEVERSGHVMRVNESSLNVTKAGTDRMVLYVSRWSTSAGDRVRYEHDTRSVAFVDTDTGEILMTFTVDELEQIDRDLGVGVYQGGDVMNVLVLSEDLIEWTAQEISFGGEDRGAYPMSLQVTDGRIVMVVAWYHLKNHQEYGFEVHSAPLPRGR